MSTSQAQIVEYALKNCLFDGWNTKLLENACESAGLDKNYWKIDFTNGAVDVVDYFINQADQNMIQAMHGSNLRTTEKIRTAIKLRLENNAQYKLQIKSMLGVYALHPVRATQATYRTVDNIWRLAGDTATDWNFYSKRLLLAGVYTSTLMFWLNDTSKDSQASWEFLDSRLAEVGKFGKTIANVKSKFKNLAIW